MINNVVLVSEVFHFSALFFFFLQNLSYSFLLLLLNQVFKIHLIVSFLFTMQRQRSVLVRGFSLNLGN